MKNVMDFHSLFYSRKERTFQDSIILKFIKVTPVKRKRSENNKTNGKMFQTKFFVKTGNGISVSVCQKAFLNILGITRTRVETIAKNFFSNGTTLTEKRGGDRKTSKFANRINSIIKFVRRFPSIEAHYCRSKTKRQYLSSNLSINKMSKMYNESVCDSLKVKSSYFRKVFVTKFNLGFNVPRTDVCSTCTELCERVKNTNDPVRKTEAITLLRIHKLRAKKFYQLLKEPDNETLVLSFDMQKNQTLPKVPDQAAYYSRQLYFHNLTVVQGNSKSKLTKDNVFCYCWTEDSFGKDSNLVSSVIYDRLIKTDLSNFKKIKLFCDGCGGQNKNSILLAMCSRFMIDAPQNIESIEIVFPVRGHSFLPPDRVFGLIEKEVKRCEVIENPQKYKDIIGDYGRVIMLGEDCKVYDWRNETRKCIKPTANWPFPISKVKRVIITKSKNKNQSLIRGEISYQSDLLTACYLTKKGKTIKQMNPDIITSNNIANISRPKLKDVEKLLTTHFGQNWRDLEILQYFVNVLNHSEIPTVPNRDEPYCEENQDDEIPIIV
jgi:hypothetical protein